MANGAAMVKADTARLAPLVSREAYGSFVRKFGNLQEGAPAEAKAGKPAKAPLDIRPAAARNKPKPKHSKAYGAKHRRPHQ